MTDETRIILNEIGTLKSSIDGMESNIKDLQTNVKDLQTNVKDLQVSLENETNRNIKLIAEGHLDLTRKLNEVLRINAEQEMLPIRMNTLENEVRKLKERVEAIA